VCIIRKGNPALRLLTNRGRENHFLCIFRPPRGSPGTAVGQITRKYRAWKALGILSQYQHKMLHNNAAQQRHGEKPASGAKGVTNHTTGTRTSKHPDFNPQATQSTRRHTSCKPDGLEHGDAHHPHPRRAQPASAIGPYDPCKTANAAAAIWPGGNARAQFRALTLACAAPSPRGRIRATRT